MEDGPEAATSNSYQLIIIFKRGEKREREAAGRGARETGMVFVGGWQLRAEEVRYDCAAAEMIIEGDLDHLMAEDTGHAGRTLPCGFLHLGFYARKFNTIKICQLLLKEITFYVRL